MKEVCPSGAGCVENGAGQISSRNRCWWLGNISRSRFLPRPSPRPPPRQDRQTVKVEMTEFFCCRFFVDLLVFGSVTVKTVAVRPQCVGHAAHCWGQLRTLATNWRSTGETNGCKTIAVMITEDSVLACKIFRSGVTKWRPVSHGLIVCPAYQLQPKFFPVAVRCES